MMAQDNSKKASHIFISYTRRSQIDCQIADFIYDFLKRRGHEAFIDISMRVGTEWLNEIDSQIKNSDYLIVLLSVDSSDSEMVQAEIRRAYEYRRLQGHPKALPIRINFDQILPYAIDAFLEQIQHIFWYNQNDNFRVAMELLDVVEGNSTTKNLVYRKPSKINFLSEDGRPIEKIDDISPPLPEFDPRFLDQLDTPGGALRINDHFYVEREADNRLKREIMKAGSTTTIRASRQTGKSSLLVRGIHYARSESKIVHFDLQNTDKQHFTSPTTFLKYLADNIIKKLGIESIDSKKFFGESLGPQDRLTTLIGEIILPKIDKQLLLSLDEADRLLETDFYSDFFALIRSWHNLRALDELWQKLNIVTVISTEPYLLIADANQSPFNVGLRLDLNDFSLTQVSDLNKKHGSPITDKDINSFMQLFGGHPYLTRKALYTLVTEKWSWRELRDKSLSSTGPFSDHLRHNHWVLQDDKNLKSTLNQVIQNKIPSDEAALLRLDKAGLVKGIGEAYVCRCGLYTEYFKGKLQ